MARAQEYIVRTVAGASARVQPLNTLDPENAAAESGLDPQSATATAAVTMARLYFRFFYPHLRYHSPSGLPVDDVEIPATDTVEDLFRSFHRYALGSFNRGGADHQELTSSAEILLFDPPTLKHSERRTLLHEAEQLVRKGKLLPRVLFEMRTTLRPLTRYWDMKDELLLLLGEACLRDGARVVVEPGMWDRCQRLATAHAQEYIEIYSGLIKAVPAFVQQFEALVPHFDTQMGIAEWRIEHLRELIDQSVARPDSLLFQIRARSREIYAD